MALTAPNLGLPHPPPRAPLMGVSGSTHRQVLQLHDQRVGTHRTRSEQRQKEVVIMKQKAAATSTKLKTAISGLVETQESHREEWKEVYTQYERTKGAKEERERMLLRSVIENLKGQVRFMPQLDSIQ